MIKVPEGKGAFLYRLWRCGAMKDLAKALHDDGFTWAVMKVANGMSHTDGSSSFQQALVDELIPLLRSYGIQVWALHYVYGMRTDNNQPMPMEEFAAIKYQLDRNRYDGLVIDAEGEYKQTAVRTKGAECAETYCKALKAGYPELPLGLCSYRFPDSHTTFPWAAFLAHVDVHMPQVYWIKATNPADQLQNSYNQLTARKALPVVAWGPAYYDSANNWRPTVEQLNAFDVKAHELELPGVCWFLWDTGIDKYPEYREAIRAHVWKAEDPLAEIREQMAALQAGLADLDGRTQGQAAALNARLAVVEGSVTYLDGQIKSSVEMIKAVQAMFDALKKELVIVEDRVLEIDKWGRGINLK